MKVKTEKISAALRVIAEDVKVINNGDSAADAISATLTNAADRLDLLALQLERLIFKINVFVDGLDEPEDE